MKRKITNWGSYPVKEANEIIDSSRAGLKASLIKYSDSFIPRGNGRCYGDASLGENVLSSLRFDYVLSFDKSKGVFECESGVMLSQVLDIIVPHGWFLPVTPGTKFITVGGAAASDIHGKNHHVDGSFCDHIQEMDVMLYTGETVTCSPQQNAELFETTRGGMGLTGFILRVKFTLKKIETSFIKQVQVKAADLSELMELFQEYKGYTYTMSWIDCLKSGKHFGRSILMAGEHAAPDELSAKQKQNMLTPYSDTLMTFPVNLPSFVLNQYSVKAFNFLYYQKNLKKYSNNVVPYDPFFYPLDKILEWNKGYGRKGFLQYQFVLPMESSKQGMTDILNRINKKGMGSFLAVFKVFGRQDNLISFPMEGCTLALDFPVRASLFPFLDELDRVVLDYGGRLYLTKDARMKSEIFWESYPGAKKFQELVKKYNPEYKFRSLQSDRLEITK
jgi:FAD/FMN-containing dehydrogenase